MLWLLLFILTALWLIRPRKREKFAGLTWKPLKTFQKPTVSPVNLPLVIQKLPSFIVKDFITPWHSQISTKKSWEDHVEQEIAKFLAEIGDKIVEIDVLKAVLTIIPVVTQHVVHYKRAMRRLTSARLGSQEHTLSHFFNLHPACIQPLPWLRNRVDTFLIPLLPPDAPLRLLVREILVNKVFTPTIDYLADPSFWNMSMSMLTDQFHDPSRLERFAQVIQGLDEEKGAVTFDEFLKNIKECSDPVEANLVRRAIVNEIRKKQSVLVGKDKNDQVDGVKVSSIVTYINRLQVARKRVEKRILKLGGTVETQSQDLEEILADETKCDVLYEFLEREGSGHLILFYKLAEELRQRPTPAQLDEILRFLEDQDPLPVSGDVQNGLNGLSDSKNSLEPIWQAQNQVFSYIQSLLPYFDARSRLHPESHVQADLVPGFFSLSVQDSTTRKGTWYTIQIQRLDPAHHGETLEIQRSHQDLVYLHKALSQAFPAAMATIEFPSTTLVGELLKSHGRILESRRLALEKYLKLCGRRNEIAKSPAFLRFLSKDPELSLPGDITPLDPVANLLLDVFDLRADKNWLRRRALILTQNLLGDMLEKKIVNSIRLISDRLEEWIGLIRDKLWPPPQRTFVTIVPRTEKEEQEMADLASFKMDAFFNEWTGMVGKTNAMGASKLIFGMFQDRTINKHLIYTIIDALIRELQ